MDEIHYSKKDFTVDWFSGSGAGGQHRNKHQNCCRITHNHSGLSAVAQNSRSRVFNKERAFRLLAAKILALDVTTRERNSNNTVIRTYHNVRGEVLDHRTNKKDTWKNVVDKGSSEIICGR